MTAPLPLSPRLQQLVFLWIGLMAFCFPISIAASSLTLFPLLGFYVLAGRWTFRTWPPAWGQVESAFALFWGISLLSALCGVSPVHSIARLEKDLYVVLLIVIGAILQQAPRQNSRWQRAFVWGGLVTAAFGILQVTVGIDNAPRLSPTLMHVPASLLHWPPPVLKQLALFDGRSTGLRSHPLTFAESLLFPLAWMLSQLAIPGKRKWWLWGSATGVLLLALVLSQSRGPWLAFGVMVLLLPLLEPRSHVFRRVGLLALFPIALILFVPSLRQRAHSIGEISHLSNAERLMMWQAGGHMLRDHPLLGVGVGNVRLVSQQYQTPEQFQAFGAWGHLHSTYVNCAAERGLLGIGTFLFFIGVLGWTILRAYRSTSVERVGPRAIMLTALLALVGWLISGLTEAVYNDTSVLMLFYLVMGLALSAAKNPSETQGTLS